MRRIFMMPGMGTGIAGDGAAVVDKTIIFDTFTDSNKSLDLHAIAPKNTPSATWNKLTFTNWVITSNTVGHPASDYDYGIATINAGAANVKITVDVTNSSASTADLVRSSGIVLRYTDASNYWAIVINAQTDSLKIVEINTGIQTVRASVSVAVNPGTYYSMVVTATGQSITATLDGANTITYASAALNSTVTTHGIFLRGSSDRGDNFKVETL